MDSHPLYCDVSLPVPLDQVFTYSLPETLRHRVQIGSRVLAPFGARKLAGIVLRTHDKRPVVSCRANCCGCWTKSRRSMMNC